MVRDHNQSPARPCSLGNIIQHRPGIRDAHERYTSIINIKGRTLINLRSDDDIDAITKKTVLATARHVNDGLEINAKKTSLIKTQITIGGKVLVVITFFEHLGAKLLDKVSKKYFPKYKH